MSRKKNATLNMLTAMLPVIVSTIMGFVSRTIFIRYLHAEFLSVNGLFSSILMIFSLAELGFGTAVSFVLYKSLADGDEEKTSALMNFLAKVYRIIGLIIILLGLLTVPLLQFFIKDVDKLEVISIRNLRIYFTLYLLATLSTYFFSYKRTLIIADQKRYIANTSALIFSVVARLLQIASLVLFSNFLLYLCINIFFNIAENIVITLICNKKYKYLRQYKHARLSVEELKAIKIKIFALAIGRIASVTVGGIISLLISTFVDFLSVGIYSNYVMIIGICTTLFTLVYQSILAGFGNYAATKTKEECFKFFKSITYLFYLIGSVFFVGLLLMINEFMVLWLSKEMVFPVIVTCIIIFDMYVALIRYPPDLVIDVYGLYEQLKYRPIVQAILFLALGIPGAIYYGIPGIFLARIIAVLLTQYWIDVYVAMKYGFSLSSKKYHLVSFKYILITAIATVASYFVILLLPQVTLFFFILKCIIIVVICLTIFFLATFRSDEFKYFFGLISSRFSKKNKSNE